MVGGVSRIASEHDIPVAVICGFADDDVADRLPTYSLTERYGLDVATSQTRRLITEMSREILSMSTAD